MTGTRDVMIGGDKKLQIKEFKLDRAGTSDMYQYDYNCGKSSRNLTCRNVKTALNDDGGGNTIFLDRHNVQCEPNEVITQFKVSRPSDNKIQYDYTCCK